MVLELVLSFWLVLHALAVKLCSHLALVLPLSTVLMVTMMMLASDVKVCRFNATFFVTSLSSSIFLATTVDSVGSTCTYGDVRLVDGGSQYEGRVEVCINDQWGTVCDNSWGTTDATTICKQLGYAYTSSMLKLNNFIVQKNYLSCFFQPEKHILTPTLDKELVQYSWTVCSALRPITNYCNVPAVPFSKSRLAVAMTMMLA